MINTILALMLSANISPHCSAYADYIQAEKDLIRAETLMAKAKTPEQTFLAIQLMNAAIERRKADIAACTPSIPVAKRNPY